MKLSTVLFALLLSALLPSALASPKASDDASTINLMPLPLDVTPNAHTLTLTGAPKVVMAGEASTRLQRAAARFEQRFARQTGLTEADSSTSLTLTVSPGEAKLLDKSAEAYTLNVTANGIELNAQSELGALHGLETLLQLIGVSDGEQVELSGVVINDKPRFAWRGLLLDSVRHFLPLDDIKRQIDGMAAAKLNVLHWHLTDDQGWRFESKSYPRLQQVASNNQYYTQAQIAEVITYAAERGIYVLPEIDMPGHASAIAQAYPELMSAPGPYPAEDRWGVHKPLLNPANPEVYKFAEAILREVAELFPFPYIHIGGDEVDPEHWETNAEIQAFAKANNLEDSHALHAYFNQRLAEIFTELDRKMIGWDEVLHPQLPAGTMVQSWQGPDALGRAINMGFPALLSTGFYLDQPQYASYHHRVKFVPEKIVIDTAPAAQETWHSWSFVAPRKRGSAVQGQLTILGKQDTLRGYIDFKGKSRQVLRNVKVSEGNIQFNVDTWMGPVTASLSATAKELTGQLLAGNAPYQLTGELVAGSGIANTQVPTALPKDYIDDDKMHLLLGGEAALWSEIVDHTTIDLRLWPRAFVVAERLWSDASVNDPASMQARLNAVSAWSVQSVGLAHTQQQRENLARLAPSASVDTLLAFSSALEPAHYYHRHHEKSEKETYSRRDPLDRIADALPSQSTSAMDFAQHVEQWLQQPDDSELTEQLKQQLNVWHSASKQLMANSDITDNTELTNLTQNVKAISQAGLGLINHINGDKPLTEGALQIAEKNVQQGLSIQHEVIVAAAFGVQQLLDSAQ